MAAQGQEHGVVEDGRKKRHVKAEKWIQPIHLHAPFERATLRNGAMSEFVPRPREADNWREDILFF